MAMEISSAYTGYAAAQGSMGVRRTEETESKDKIAQEEERNVAPDKKSFNSTKELADYLYQEYNTVKKGMVKISGSYLRACLTDEDKRQELFDNLKNADDMDKNGEENIKGYQGMKITIDEKGRMETETYGGSIAFNEGKRARQLAAAKNASQVQMVMTLLNKDLSDCQYGVRNGMCDENEVQKVKAMIQQAQKKMSEVNGNQSSEDEKRGVDEFSINMLI